MEIGWYRQALSLRHRWTTAHGTTTQKDTLVVVVGDGIARGHGEAAPVSYHGQSLASAERALARAASEITRAEIAPEKYGGWLYRDDVWPAFREVFSGESAAAGALDAALWDLSARRAGVPLFQLLHAESATRAPRTGLSIGIDTPESMGERAREAVAAGFAAVKVKVGRASPDEDEAAVAAVRAAAPGCALRVDANGGFQDARDARARMRTLARYGVEVFEQPLPPGNLEACRELRDGLRADGLGGMLVLDEDCVGPMDVARCAPACDGVNIKLSKCGGITPALEMIRDARARGLRVMLGCMVESSLGIAAAAHLAPLADLLDLDGHLLLEQDPWTGLHDPALPAGTLVLDRAPGLGLVRA